MSRLLLLLLLITLGACDNRADYLKETNAEPTIELSGHLNPWNLETDYKQHLTDTIKVSKYPNYRATVKITDDSKELKVSSDFRGDLGIVYYNGDVLIGPTEIDDDEFELVYGIEDFVQKYGVNGGQGELVKLEIFDGYNAEGYGYLQLFVFYNLSPIVNVSYINTAVLDPFEVQIDASSSFDQDEKYGGGIDMYEYKIPNSDTTNYVITTGQSVVNHIFEQAGIYIVKIRVKDNDQVWSGYQSITISL